MSRVGTSRTASGFSGSYLNEDVEFLLKQVHMDPTPVEQKERLIQEGSTHYSEMISDERKPDARYLEIFQAACGPGVPRLARDIRSLTVQILDLVNSGHLNPCLTLCSLVRAGVPYGILLRRDLNRFGVDVAHFGVSIIRDRGLDEVAMQHVLSQRPEGGIVFVDGWTGKGAIATELERSWWAMTRHNPCLAVVADPCGRASLCGSREDWLIPSGILGGNISGLVSRSILRSDLIGPKDFHGCILLDDLADIDQSRSFVDRVDDELIALPPRVPLDPDAAPLEGPRFRMRADATIKAVAKRFSIQNRNRIKPGIAEATRALLRRSPDTALVRSIDGDPDITALVHLCREDGISVIEAPDLTGPYRAITIIRKTT